MIKKDSVLHFNLGKLKYFDYEKLFNEPARYDTDKFILSLALAHGDIKGLLLYWEIMSEFRPETPSKGYVSARYGQASGIGWFIYRYLVGALDEILVLIEKNRNLINSGAFAITVSKLDSNSKDTWVKLISLARNIIPEKDLALKQLRNNITAIRDNISFHYSHHDKLADGYKNAFENGDIRPDGRAYFVVGNNLEATSFLFSDAAIETILQETFGTNDVSIGKDPVTDFIRIAHSSIAMIIQQYLKQIQANVTVLGPSNVQYEIGKSRLKKR